jgi:hypothetical protein
MKGVSLYNFTTLKYSLHNDICTISYHLHYFSIDFHDNQSKIISTQYFRFLQRATNGPNLDQMFSLKKKNAFQIQVTACFQQMRISCFERQYLHMPPGDNTAVTQPCYRRTYSCIIPGR